ncbi:MAG: anti-sigma factor antagonist [Spirochaetes bacterium]|nr:anti-sigma factor antagonist [Spirochaetota bacterium]
MPLKLLSINLDFRNPGNRGELPALAGALDPDFLLLIESLPGDAERVEARYPHRATSPGNPAWGHGLDILSKYPLSGIRALRAGDGIPMLLAQADTLDGGVELIAVHLNPTTPHAGLGDFLRSSRQRRAQFRLLRREAGRLPGMSLIAGDFNSTPWMPGMPRLRRRYRDLVKEAGADEPTYRYVVPLRLDYVMGRGVRPVRARTLETPWTDHRGLLVEFEAESAPEAEIDPRLGSGVNYAMDIRTEKKGKWYVVHIEGRLDVMLSQQLESMVFDAIGKGELNVLFNLAKVEYMSSSGLRVFISTMRKVGEKQGEMRLCHMSDSVRKILKIVDLEGMFNIFPTEEEAVK